MRSVPELKPTALFVGHSAKRSGGELALAQLLRYLPHTGPGGFDCRVALFEAGEMEEIYAERGVRVHDHLHGLLGTETRRSAERRALLTQGIRAATSLPAVRKALLATRPSVVVTNSMKAALAAQLALADGGVPVVHLVREPLTTPNFGHSQAAVLRRVLARGALQIANSPATAQTLLGRTRTLLPPVERPPALGLPVRTGPPDECRLLILGSVSAAKGQARAVEELAPLLTTAAAGSRPLKLDIVGSAVFAGDDLESARLREMVERRGLAGTVRFWPWTTDPFSAIDDADVVIVPSQVNEGFSQVAAQALLAGAPTVLPVTAGIVSAVELPSAACTFSWDVAGSFGRAVDTALTHARTQPFDQRRPNRDLARLLSPARVAGELEGMLRSVIGLPPIDSAHPGTERRVSAPRRHRARTVTKVHA